MANQKRMYELMLAVRGSLTENEAKEVFQALQDEITQNQGEINYHEVWGKIKMAYTIKQETEAYYFVITFNYDVSLVRELELYLELDRNVIRHLVTKLNPKKEYLAYTKAMYDEGMESYWDNKNKRKINSTPKTRATTAAQLEADMQRLKKGPKTESAEEALEEIINKDLSL